jgi:Flp pilus assembly pilin Flp
MRDKILQFRTMICNDDGATLIEYALVVALIAIVCVLAVTSLGRETASHLGSAANGI